MFIKVLRRCLGLKPAGFKLVGIYVADNAAGAMKSVLKIQAIQHQSIKKEQLPTEKIDQSSLGVCPATLISEYDYKQAQKAGAQAFNRDNQCRNLVISGITMEQLQGREFSIGDAIFQFDKPEPFSISRGRVDEIESQSGSICLRVLQDGGVKLGDKLELKERRKNRREVNPGLYSI